MNQSGAAASAEAERLLRLVAHGHVQDAHRRASLLSLVSDYLDIMKAASEPLGGFTEVEQATYERLLAQRQGLLNAASFDAAAVKRAMLDWTAPQLVGENETELDVAALLAETARTIDRPDGIYAAVLAATRQGLPTVAGRRKVARDLDRRIRIEAAEGNVAQVCAAALLAAAMAHGSAADCLLAAITTPAFRVNGDRGALRILYECLAALAHPRVSDRKIAVEAASYLLSRERPGSEEVEILGPVAAQSERQAGQFVRLIGKWLQWRGISPANDDVPHVARNAVCSCALSEFRALAEGLGEIGHDECGPWLVEHLLCPNNEALFMLPDDGGDPAAEHRTWPFTVTLNARVKNARVDWSNYGTLPIELPRLTPASNQIRSSYRVNPLPLSIFSSKTRRPRRG